MGKDSVLIIEDNRIIRDMACEMLEQSGFTTIQAESAEQGIPLVQETHPDLILMDMNLPGKDGYEATRILKSMPKYQSIPVIAFTAHAMQEEQQKALAAGCSGTILKPIEFDQFAVTIRSYINRAKTPNPDTPPDCREPKQRKLSSIHDKVVIKLAHDLRSNIYAEHRGLNYLATGKAGAVTETQREFINELVEVNRTMRQLLDELLIRYEEMEKAMPA